MALFSESTPTCARKLFDTADIVREAIYLQLRPEIVFRGMAQQIRLDIKYFGHKLLFFGCTLTAKARLNWDLGPIRDNGFSKKQGQIGAHGWMATRAPGGIRLLTEVNDEKKERVF
jgi:hypothetical protein